MLDEIVKSSVPRLLQRNFHTNDVNARMKDYADETLGSWNDSSAKNDYTKTTIRKWHGRLDENHTQRIK